MSKHELGEERQEGGFKRKEEQELARGDWSLWYENGGWRGGEAEEKDHSDVFGNWNLNPWSQFTTGSASGSEPKPRQYCLGISAFQTSLPPHLVSCLPALAMSLPALPPAPPWKQIASSG